MATITSDDNLFATAYMRGIEFFSISGSGFSGLGEIIEKIRHHAGANRGMVTENVRNATRGWSQSSSVYLM